MAEVKDRRIGGAHASKYKTKILAAKDGSKASVFTGSKRGPKKKDRTLQRTTAQVTISKLHADKLYGHMPGESRRVCIHRCTMLRGLSYDTIKRRAVLECVIDLGRKGHGPHAISVLRIISRG